MLPYLIVGRRHEFFVKFSQYVNCPFVLRCGNENAILHLLFSNPLGHNLQDLLTSTIGEGVDMLARGLVVVLMFLTCMWS